MERGRSARTVQPTHAPFRCGGLAAQRVFANFTTPVQQSNGLSCGDATGVKDSAAALL